MPAAAPGIDLHALIHALQPMEKRYFKLYASRMGQQRAKKYLLLYDFLLIQPAWSEEAVRAAFAGEAFVRQLNIACLYLYDLLLASLRGYDQDRTAASESGRRLDEVALLWARKLYGPCLRRIQSARRYATRLDLPAFHLQLLDFEIRLYRAQPGKAHWQAMAEAIDLSRTLAEQVRLEAALNGCYSQLFALETWPTPQLGADREALMAEIASDPLLSCGVEALAFDARLLYYKIHFLLAKGRHDLPGQLAAQAHKLATWDARPHRIDLEPERYLQAIHSYIDYAIEAEEFDGVPAALRKMQVLLRRARVQGASFQLGYLHLDLRYRLNIADFPAALELTAAVRAVFDQHPDAPLSAQHITLCINAAFAHFLMASWTGCLDWLARLEPLLKGGLRIQASLLAGAMRLMALYAATELDDLELATRAWRRNADAGPLAPQLAEAFDALKRSPSLTAERTLLQGLLDALADEHTHPQVSALTRNWVRARLEERPLRTYYGGKV
jgi:hypothetical protein